MMYGFHKVGTIQNIYISSLNNIQTNVLNLFYLLF